MKLISVFDPSDWVALGSFVVAAAALGLALSTSRSNHRRARAALYLDLKARFANVYKDLAFVFTQSTLPKDASDRLSVFAYWQHSFDEWYSTVKLGQRLERDLWIDYFAPQVVDGLRHGALREAFIFLSTCKHELGGKYKSEFYREVESIYKKYHDGHSIPNERSSILQELIEKYQRQ